MKRIAIWWLLLLTFCIYFPSLTNPFIWDDEQFIYRNAFVQNFAVTEIFTQNTIAGAGEVSNYYRPLTTLSFALDFQIWGLTPFGFHLTNVSLHILAGFLLWNILKKIQLPHWSRVGITGIFLLHPLQTEAVTYINSRGDSLYTVYGLLSILLLLLALEGTKKISIYNLELRCTPWVLGVLSALSYAMSILSKEIGLAVGGLLALVVAWKLWRQYHLTKLSLWKIVSNYKTAVSSLAIAALIGVGYLGLRATVLNFDSSFNFYTEGSIYGDHLHVRLLTFSKIIFIYLKLLLLPYPLHMERSTELVTTILSPWPWLSLSLFGGLIWAGFLEWTRKQTTIIWFGVAWMASMLAPVSGIIPINGLLYEHWLYLPIIGWAITVVGILRLLPTMYQLLHSHRVLLLSLVFCCLSVLTIRQNYIWGDHIRFYSYILTHTQSARVHNNLAMAYADDGQADTALAHYYTGLELGEQYPQIHHNIGNAYLTLGETNKAITAYKKALDLNQTFFHSYYALLDVYIANEQYPEAIALLQEGQQHLPSENNFHIMEMILYDRMENSVSRDKKIIWIQENLQLDAELSTFLNSYYRK
ncbi:MAG: tetratricopeptide repeat protein [Patescibacteria group bacterium]